MPAYAYAYSCRSTAARNSLHVLTGQHGGGDDRISVVSGVDGHARVLRVAIELEGPAESAQVLHVLLQLQTLGPNTCKAPETKHAQSVKQQQR